MKRLIAIAVAVVLLLTMAVTAPVAASPGPGLVGQWHLDEGSGKTAYDSSGLDNDGTLSGGRFGGALSFDGTDDTVTIPHSTSLNLDTAITVEVWIYADTLGTQNGIIRKGLYSPGVTKSWGLDIQHTGGVKKARFFIYDEETPYIAYSAAVSTGAWHHLVGTYDGSTVDIYLDGSNTSSTPVSHSGDIDTNTEDIVIGKRDGGLFFDGLIDEVRISDVARASFVLTTPPSADDDTVALWHFDGDANDSSGNDNDGTIHGASWVPAGPTWTTGMFGNALSFDGVDDYVHINDSLSLDITGPITVEAWVKFNSLAMNKDSVIARKGLAYSLQKYTDNKLEGWVMISGTWYGVRGINGGTTLTYDQWYHLAFTYDGINVRTYVNGSLDRVGAVVGNIDATAGNASIGTDLEGHNAYTAGIIDEVSIWDVALTPDEIDWLPPVTNADFVLQAGTTLPLKFQLFDGDVLVTSPQWVSVEVTAEGFTTKTYMLGDGVENLRWNADGAYYIANLKTKVGDWPPGIYTATVCGIVTDTITFELSADTGVGRGNSGK